MAHEQIDLTTREGRCSTHVFTPADWVAGSAVIFYMDAAGVRPAALEMARRLADAGYLVLLPDLFYRYGSYGPFDLAELMKGDFLTVLGPIVATTGNAKAAQDTEAFLAFLDTRADVTGQKIGAVGFCIGGGMAIAAAGTHPDRFGAVVSFHGGNLATDAADSPHSYAPNLKAHLYVAAAADDPSYPPQMAQKLESDLREAGVAFEAETYPAAHGWMKPDFLVFDEAAAERGWERMLAILDRELR